MIALLMGTFVLSGCQGETLADKIDSQKVKQASSEIVDTATQSALFKETAEGFTNGVKDSLKKQIDEF